jgi:hypothetical protein
MINLWDIKSLPWIVLAVGYAIFGVGFSMAGDIALTYLTDCYPDVSEV